MTRFPCTPIQYPSGRWGFAGNVPVELAFEGLDGGPADPQEVETACRFGARFAKVRHRSWATKEEALAAQEKPSEVCAYDGDHLPSRRCDYEPC